MSSWFITHCDDNLTLVSHWVTVLCWRETFLILLKALTNSLEAWVELGPTSPCIWGWNYTQTPWDDGQWCRETLNELPPVCAAGYCDQTSNILLRHICWFPLLSQGIHGAHWNWCFLKGANLYWINLIIILCITEGFRTQPFLPAL